MGNKYHYLPPPPKQRASSFAPFDDASSKSNEAEEKKDTMATVNEDQPALPAENEREVSAMVEPSELVPAVIEQIPVLAVEDFLVPAFEEETPGTSEEAKPEPAIEEDPSAPAKAPAERLAEEEVIPVLDKAEAVMPNVPEASEEAVVAEPTKAETTTEDTSPPFSMDFRQRLPRNEKLFGRSNEVGHLLKLWKPGMKGRIAVIGLGGIGYVPRIS